MQLHRLGKSLFGKTALAAAALGGFLFLAGAPGLQAADRDDAPRRADRDDGRFNRDRDDCYYNRRTEQWRREEAFERYRNAYRRDGDRDRDDYRFYHRDRDDYRYYHRDRDRDRD